jgi:hypothetical protein
MGWDFLDEAFSRVIRVAGLAGVVWEALVEHVDRPYLLFMFACMMGLAKWSGISSMFERRDDHE